MNKEEQKFVGGLQLLPPDSRDLSHSTVFGAMKFEDLPKDDFFVSELLGIKDQGIKDFCAAYASAEVSEDQEGVELNPEFTFQAAKKLLGGEAWKSWGLNLRDVCNAAIKIGFLEQQYYPFDGRTDVDRDFLANPANWPEDLEVLASEHRKASYFAVDGPHETFDNIRMTMWINRSERRSVLTGVLWRYAWNNVPGGIIPKTGWEDSKGEGHAFKVLGQMYIEKELHLVVVNSWGAEVGDGGIFYFPAEVVNKEFTYGAFTYKDIPVEKAKILNENKLCIDANSFVKICVILWNYLSAKIKPKQ